MNLTTLRKKELNKILNSKPNFGCQGDVGKFLDVYLISEVLIRKLIYFYVKDKKNESKVKTTSFNIHQLKLALAHFNIPFDERDLNLLFIGGEGKRGFKTARQLRNGYIHSLSKIDYQEIVDNAGHFIALLEQFTEKVGLFNK